MGMGAGEGVGDTGLAGLAELLCEHEEPVATGHEAKHGRMSTTEPSARVTTKPAVPLAPPGDALQVAPLTRLIENSLPSTCAFALCTAPGRLEKMTLVYQALLPSRTVATAGPSVSHSTGSYVIGKTPVVAPVMALNASTWQSKVFALPESTICTTKLPGRPASVT